MSTGTEQATTLDRTQSDWLQKMSAALGLTVASKDGLVGAVAAKEADGSPAPAQLETADDLLLDFVCRIVIVNKTDVALSKGPDKVEQGRYQIRPQLIVPAHQSVPFTVVGKIFVIGSITWVPDGGLGERWELEYGLAPAGLVSPKLSASRVLNSGRFNQALDDSRVSDKVPELRFILSPKGPPPAPQSFVSRVIIRNETDLVLRKSSESLSAGVFETAPPSTIPARQVIDFEVRSQGTPAQVQQQFVAGDLTWTPDGQANPQVWSLRYAAATGLTSTADADIRSDRLIAVKPTINGTSFEFILRDKNDPPPPRPESFLSRVVVSNTTTVPLTRVSDSLVAGVFEPKPRDTVPPGQKMEFAIRSEQNTDTGQPREIAGGSVVWHPEGAANGEDWLIQFVESPKGKDESSSSTIQSQRFVASQPDFSTIFFFSLKELSLPPNLNEFVSRVVVVNNTDVALQQKEVGVTPGTFDKKPPSTIPAKTSAEFSIKSQQDPSDGTDVLNGFVGWEPDGATKGELWRMSFFRRSTDQDGSPQQDLSSTRFSAEEPSSKGTDFRFTLSQAAEPEFKKPEPTRQPTLRLDDKGVDGWVEYVQEQLNALLKPSPNLKVDGSFGPATQKAVFAFQIQAAIQKDGTVGNQTWAALRHGPAEEPGTDKRTPHTFKEEGLEARWITEDAPATFSQKKDELVLVCVSLGDQTSLEGQKVNVFVTPPGGNRKGFVAKIGERIEKSKTGQGDNFKITVADFRKTFPSIPETAPVQGYIIEAFFDKELGGDFYTSTKGGFNAVE